jgi:hypothetical protein
MALTLSLPTTTQVESRLETYRNRINTQRVDNGLDPYATVQDMLVDYLKKQYATWLEEMFIDDAHELVRAYIQGTDQQQKDAKAVFGI